MIAFEILLNGERLVIAGREDLCVLGSILSCSFNLKKIHPTKIKNDDFFLHVGGLSAPQNGDQGEHLDWIGHRELNINDELKIRILEMDEADLPKKRRPQIDDCTSSSSE
ncbi:MAG: hypothetical protein AB7S78_09795 [Candidatus Omnitrophota bacterium]